MLRMAPSPAPSPTHAPAWLDRSAPAGAAWAPLSVLASDDLDETRDQIARIYKPHDLAVIGPRQRVRARMQEIVARHLPLTNAELVFAADGYPPMAPTAGNRALLAGLNAVNRDLGLPEMPEYDPARRGAADSSFVAADADTLAGMGVAGGGSHAEGEWISLSSLPRQTTRAAILMTRLSREPRQ